jgi:hypothetical protein
VAPVLPVHSVMEHANASIEAIEATREEYAAEALVKAVADVVELYRGGGSELPPRLPALDRLAAAYESYTRLTSSSTPGPPGTAEAAADAGGTTRTT